MFLDLLVQGAARNAQTFGGLLHLSMFLLQYTFDVLLFQFEEGKARIQEGGTNTSVPVEMKVLDRNAVLIA
jgi:hypothetical protein